MHVLITLPMYTKVVEKINSFFYQKVRQLSIQSATGVSKCDQGIINC